MSACFPGDPIYRGFDAPGRVEAHVFHLATLTFLPAYREARLDSTLYPTFEYDNRGETSKQTSVGARLGRSDDQLKWVVGGFFFDEAQTANFQVLSGAVQSSLIGMNIKTRSYAAFGQATYSILDPLRVIAGVRYTSDRREMAGQSFDGNPSWGCPRTFDRTPSLQETEPCRRQVEPPRSPSNRSSADISTITVART